MNRNVIITITTSILILVAISGLAYWYLKPEPTRTLKIASGGPGGTYYAFASALAEIVNANSNKVRITVQKSKGANDNANRISNRSADLGLIQSDTVVTKNVNIAARLFPELFHLIARTNSGIKSVSDLRNRRLALPPKGSGSTALFTTLSSHYEMGADNINIHYGGLNENIQLLEQGKVDALFVVMAMGNEKIKSIIKSLDVELISVKQAKAISLYHPALRADTIPIGAYSGEKPIPAQPINIISVDSLLAVSDTLEDKHVKELTAILFEKRQELIQKIPQAAFVAQPTDSHRLAYTVHAGAQRFYQKDEPPFLVKYAEQIGLGITVILLVFSSIWQLRSWISNSRKNRADHYNKDLIDITERVNKASTIEDLEEIRGELFTIFKQVIKDLDEDRIEEESLQSFSFAWEVVLSNLNHRQLVLTNLA